MINTDVKMKSLFQEHEVTSVELEKEMNLEGQINQTIVLSVANHLAEPWFLLCLPAFYTGTREHHCLIQLRTQSPVSLQLRVHSWAILQMEVLGGVDGMFFLGGQTQTLCRGVE